MPTNVFVQERTGKPIGGTMARIANSVDQNTRTMLAEVDIDNHDGSLYPGMYAVVTFVQVRGVSPLVIPGDAIVVRKDRTAVAWCAIRRFKLCRLKSAVTMDPL
jgi:multidrug efflux pump subunit AcrA (membrane-fusion protein)